MVDIVIETESGSGLAEKLPDAESFTPKHFAGGPELVHVLVSLTAVTLPLIAKAVIETIRAGKHVRVVIKDGKSGANLDIKGVSGDQATKIVERYLDEILKQ